MNKGLMMKLMNDKAKEGRNERGRDGDRDTRYGRGEERGMHYPMPRPWPPYGGEPEMRYDDGINGAYSGYDHGMPAESRRYRNERGRYTSRPTRRRAEYDGGMDMRYGDGGNGTEMRRIGFQSEPWEDNTSDRERRPRAEYGGKIIPMRHHEEEEDEEDEDDPAKNRSQRRMVRAGGTFWMDPTTDASDVPEMTKEDAKEWVASMRGSDPTRPKGGRWSMEDVKPYAQRMGIPTDGKEFYEFFAIMNAMYSNYFEVAKKHNLQNNPAFFADLAKAWLHDEDAVPNKAAMYYECIVKHE